MLTGVIPLNNNETGTKGAAASVDWIIQQAINGREPLGFATSFIANLNGYSKFCWKGPGMPNDPKSNLQDVYGRFFPAGTPGGMAPQPMPDMADPAQKELEAQQCSLNKDALVEDTRKLLARLSAEEKPRLEHYLTNLEMLRCGVVNPGSPGGGMPGPGCSKPQVSASLNFADPRLDWRAAAGAQLKVIASAFACGTTDVATITFGNPGRGLNVYTVELELEKKKNGLPTDSSLLVYGSGTDAHHHEASHNNINNLNHYGEIMRIYAEFYRDILSVMKAKGLLQDVVVVWTTDMFHKHSDANREVLVGGGGSGGIRTGMIHDFSAKADAKERSLYRVNPALAHLMGVPQDIGDTKLFRPGPLEFLTESC